MHGAAPVSVRSPAASDRPPAPLACTSSAPMERVGAPTRAPGGAGGGAKGAGGRMVEALRLALAVAAALLRTLALLAAAAVRVLLPRTPKDLQGRVVLVTGAGRGLGRELALQFAACGCLVVCVDTDQASNEATARAINLKVAMSNAAGAGAGRRAVREARAVSCDVSSAAQVQAMAAAVLADVGHVDVLVNNAGIMPVQPLLHTKPQQVADVVSVNLLSHFWTLLAFLPSMVSRDSGHVVAISSMAGLAGLANKVPYSASKFAVSGLMDALSEELRLNAHHVKVTCVHPYFIHTRPDLPQDLHLRIPELSPAFAAAEVIRAVREEASCVTVPRNLLFWLNVLRALPQDARNVWRDVFYARVLPTDNATSTPSPLSDSLGAPAAAAVSSPLAPTAMNLKA